MKSVNGILWRIERNSVEIVNNRADLLGDDPYRQAAAARLNREYARANLKLWGEVAELLEMECLQRLARRTPETGR